ncbi:beta-ketoacyl synthase N-terminal-like domain-containing protein [Streptomyces europaeiscabiei]|uniref:Beta-ketoacyl synthase N-terminal-like domain-containing protein n=1 Tax=Streptomyces europaeiscabiei TaxID=146819 RepID=A0AAJ2PJR8_9ACTN|nr:beta-ketoacyl synthase N-terminal-like domain-containing protein [Streptomyces europaeiscabiei]MDX3128453.1 beta-ketoacyl synthase N-terminal-like domain-containing protein [Streptomyces europaeiscabiei]
MTGQRVVISGMGLVTPLGAGVDRFWSGLVAGDTVLEPARRFTSAEYEGEPVGEVPGRLGPADGPRKQHFTRVAVEEALAAARLPSLPPGSLVFLVGQARAPLSGRNPRLDGEEAEFFGPPDGFLDAPDGLLKAPDGLLGSPDGKWSADAQVLHLSHACASAAFAMNLARAALRAGAAPAALVAGASVLNRYEYASMRVVRAVARSAARPFDTGRAGISLGEGGAALLLETASAARSRGLPADLTVAGVCCRVAGDKPAASSAEVVTDCLRTALRDAGADRLDHVHAHATGTRQGDAAELRAIETVAAELDAPAVPVSSHKGAIGHLLHVSAVPAIAAAALALRTGTAPPTAGLARPEPTERVRLPLRAEPLPGARLAAVNNFGFGGNNASVVLRRH